MAATPIAKAQQKPVYNILWRIEGKGLTKPSYLFGTMHVKDNRAFRFSDSVMLAIQSCRAFALEVHPDTLIKKMFTTLNDQDSIRNVRKWLTDAEYNKLAKRFKEKNGFPIGNLDPIRIEAMMKPEKIKPDDKKSFVDAYLYGIARSMNKNIFGLENTSEKFEEYYGNESDLKTRVQDLVDDDNEEEKLATQEKLIKIYSTGNLETIKAYLGNDGLDDDETIARNKVMLAGIIAQIHQQPLFAAVGVAHLPGDNGLIALLKNSGYTVSPVTATFTGVAGKFNTDYTKLNWKTYTDEENGYSIDLPFMPMQTKSLYGISSIIFPDMANDMFFGAYAIQKGSTARPITEDEVMRKAINNFSINQNNHLISKTPIWVNGLKGTDVVVRTSESTIRFRLLVTHNYLYCLYGGNTLQNINSVYANRFFNSFKSIKLPEKTDPTWITFKNDTAAFSVSLPGQPMLLKKEVPNPKDPASEPFEITVYMATDTVNLENYLVRYNDYPKGMYLANKQVMLESLTSEFEKKGKVIGKPRKIFKDGNEGREADVILNEVLCKIQLFVRGNRTYLIMESNIPEGKSKQSTNAFFESFKFTPYVKTTFVDFVFDGGNLKVKTFADTKSIIDTASSTSFLGNTVSTNSTNPASGGLYIMEHGAMSNYYKAKNIDSVYKHFITNSVGYQDSLLKTDTINVNGIAGREYIVQKKGSEDKKRNRLFIINADVITLSSRVANEELFSDASNTFYNSLQKINETPSINLSGSKAEKITGDLSSADTLVRNSAKGALSYYDFEKDELPYLYKAIERAYEDDTAKYGVRSALITTLLKVNDDKTTGVLKSLYIDKHTNDRLKVKILGAIPEINKKEGYEIYLDLLTNYPALKSDELYRAFSPMYDSVEYVAANFNRILPLLKYPEYRKKLLSVTQQMTYVKDKQKYSGLLKNNFNQLTAFAQEDLDNYLSKDTVNNKYFSSGYSYLQLMQSVKNEPITDKFTAKLIKNGLDEYHFSDAVITRINNRLNVDQKLLNKLLDSIDVRYSLMEALNKEKQLSRVPPKYKKADEFAKLCLYQSMTGNDDEGGSPKNITLLGSILDKGNIYYAFKYTQEYDEDNNVYLALCGPYKPGISKLKFGNSYHAYYDSIIKKNNWQLQAKKMLIKLKEQNTAELANLPD